MLKLINVKKTYTSLLSSNNVEALRGVNFTMNDGEFISIMGESGSGKSTLLNIISTIDDPSEGQVILNDLNLETLSKSQKSIFRRENLGFVFQNFNLLDTMTVRENIALPLVLSQEKKAEIDRKVLNAAGSLNIIDLLDKYPFELSGGQNQRVAAARAIVNEPDLLLCDEPTGQLDSKNSLEFLELLKKLNRFISIIMVTHSAFAASKSNRVLFIKDGIIIHDIYRGDLSEEEFYKRIVRSQSMILGGQNDF